MTTRNPRTKPVRRSVGREVVPGLFLFEDTCNVYVLVRDGLSLAIDFGSGDWLKWLRKLGLPPLEHVFLTHHHADQCEGLLEHRREGWEIHAPAGDKPWLGPEEVERFWAGRRGGGNPASYSVLPRGISGVSYDLVGWHQDVWLGNERVRCIHTPGHGPAAVTIVFDHRGRQIGFSGDAAHAGATVHEAHHLEWDHWTGSGALAAWEGIVRLADVRLDLLCPSHGPVVPRPRRMLLKLADKLLEFYRVKGNIAADEPDDYLVPTHLSPGVRRLLPSLYQFGTNGYLVRSRDGSSLVVDPYSGDLPALDELLRLVPGTRVTDTVATHYHFDHIDAMPTLKARFGATGWLHPVVAEPLRKPGAIDAPWLMREPLRPDRLLPRDGVWKWRGHAIRCEHFPGQTWWHACLMMDIDNTRALFGGDNFQPNSRWNATGGFSSFNGSRFHDGFERSAKLVLDWSPDVILNGHCTFTKFRPSYFRKVVAWSRRAEKAIQSLCPGGDLDLHYHLHHR